MNWMLLVFLAISQLVQAGLFGGKTGVRELSPSSFKNEVLLNGNVSVVAFYAPWCGYCQQLDPELKKVAKSLKGIARVSAVNCDNPVNKALCSRYKVQGFPTLKVFQPAKLTDVDFKDVLEGKPVPRRKPKMFAYSGARTAPAIMKFVIGKLRNYAASLNSDDALRWMAPNLVPRVIMLPGKKYKSKSVSPLFKVLSREYFGKMRFAYVPRRVDGAWNLLGLQAPEESQLVYMSDDKEPVIYKGSMKKGPIMRFLEEQYSLEMDRRQYTGKTKTPDRDNAANGLEYVDEDAQDGVLEHVRQREERFEKEKAEAIQAKIEAYRRSGAEFDEEELAAELSAKIDEKIGSSKTKTQRAVQEDVDEEYVMDFDDGAVAEAVIEEIDDSEDDVAALDESIVEVSPDEMVQEGPEALSSYLSSLKQAQGTKTASASLDSSAAASASAKITPSAISVGELGIRSYETFVKRCLRTGYGCAVAVVRNDTLEKDLSNFAKAVRTVPSKMKQKTLFEFFVTGEDADLDAFLRSVAATQTPGLIYYDPLTQKLAVMHKDWTTASISDYLKGIYANKIKADTKIPSEYLYWVTKDEVKARMNEKKSKTETKEETKAEPQVKDEL